MQIFGPPTIDQPTFDRVIRSFPTSPILAERPPVEYYQRAVMYGIDPAFPLLVGYVEHRFGTAPTAVVARYAIKNWANCRSRRNPGLGGMLVQTDKGDFWSYPSWLQSFDDLCFRLREPGYDYQRKGATTVETALPLLSPASDGNNPDAYIATALALIGAWQAQSKGTTMSILKPIQIVEIDHTKTKFGGYTSGTRQQLMICDHITSPPAGTLSDRGSLGWLRDPHLDANGDDQSPSVNYLISRAGKAIEVVDPHGPAPWTNGINYAQYPNGKNPNMANPLIADITRRKISPNQICVTIEHEGYNGAGMTPAQWATTTLLHIWLCAEFKITPDEIHIVGHNQWDGIDRPNCPGWTPAQWAKLRGDIQKALAAGGVALPAGGTPTGGGIVREPGVDQTIAYINDKGQAIVVSNYGGSDLDQVTVNTADQGVSARNKNTKAMYDKSQKGNKMQQWDLRK